VAFKASIMVAFGGAEVFALLDLTVSFIGALTSWVSLTTSVFPDTISVILVSLFKFKSPAVELFSWVNAPKSLLIVWSMVVLSVIVGSTTGSMIYDTTSGVIYVGIGSAVLKVWVFLDDVVVVVLVVVVDFGRDAGGLVEDVVLVELSLRSISAIILFRSSADMLS